jgi:hypothetical protein
VVYAVARARAGGRFTYTTPLWPDARGYLVGLFEEHAAAAIAAAAVDVARRAHAAAHQVPTAPPADAWSVQLREYCYELARQDLPSAPDPHQRPSARRRRRLDRLPLPRVERPFPPHPSDTRATGVAMSIDNQNMVLDATDPLASAPAGLRIIHRFAEQADRLDDDPLSLVDGRHQRLAAAQRA